MTDALCALAGEPPSRFNGATPTQLDSRGESVRLCNCGRLVAPRGESLVLRRKLCSKDSPSKFVLETLPTATPSGERNKRYPSTQRRTFLKRLRENRRLRAASREATRATPVTSKRRRTSSRASQPPDNALSLFERGADVRPVRAARSASHESTRNCVRFDDVTAAMKTGAFFRERASESESRGAKDDVIEKRGVFSLGE